MTLTDREEQVLDAASLGLTDKETAKRLGISPFTVRSHWRMIRGKLGAANKAQAVILWERHHRTGVLLPISGYQRKATST